MIEREKKLVTTCHTTGKLTYVCMDTMWCQSKGQLIYIKLCVCALTNSELAATLCPFPNVSFQWNIWLYDDAKTVA